MIVAVLDASSLIAALLGEPGGDKVKPILEQSAMTTANFAEVVSYLARRGTSEADIRSSLDPIPVVLIELDQHLAYAAGLLLPATRAAGLSLGDRCCLALARHLGTRALTADRAWMTVARVVGVRVELIR